MQFSFQFWLIVSGSILGNLFAVLSPSQAQISPDATLPNNSSIIIEGSTSNITGGTQAGTNLFHSFEQFSLPTGATAYFNNGIDIQNIITRVTGSSISNIDGTLKANGNANLFLLNPTGIIFGANARLNIGGSFIGSTASIISFADGNIFNTRDTQTAPLLTVSAPVGLGFGDTPAPIRVLGSGHNILARSFQPIERNNPTVNLQVGPQKTLAIVGGNVSLEGGILTAEGGRIELGGIEQGLVRLSATSSSWSLSYEGVSSFGDVSLSQESLVDASGFYNGSIQITGRRLQLKDGSLALIQNQGLFSTDLAVSASESLYIEGIEPTGAVFSGFWLEDLGLGRGGQITVSAPQLTLQSSAQIFSSTFGDAEAADINISANKFLQIIGRQTGEIGSAFISSLSSGNGQSGNITISTGQLNIANGGFILTGNIVPFVPGTMSGNSGDIEISASDFVKVDGIALDLFNPSAISAATFSNGSAGDVIINTSKLVVSNGGRVDSSTSAVGTAGSVSIYASDSIEVSGVAPSSGEPSLVTSAATTLDQTLRDALRLFEDPTGVSGELLINTRQLTVADEGQISVRNDGTGNGGTLEINADFVNLNNQAEVTALTQSGQGGDIRINSGNLLLMRRNSRISTSAGIEGASGDGGDITINTSTLTALENSDISANSAGSRGGNVTINAQAIIGTEFRDELTPESDITATGSEGKPDLSGTVEINTPEDVNSSRALANLPAEVVDATALIAQSCPGGGEPTASKFVNTGTGGIPPSPGNLLYGSRGWEDNSLPTQSLQNVQEPKRLRATEPMEIVEAQGWRQNLDGTITLTAEANTVVPYSSLATPPCYPQPSASEVSASRNAAKRE